MTEPTRDDPRTWRFLRTAGLVVDDRSVVSTNGTLWDAGRMEGGEPYLVWLTPAEVMNHSLTDQVREGVQREREYGRKLTSLEHELRVLAGESEGTATLCRERTEGAQSGSAYMRDTEVNITIDVDTTVVGRTDDWRWSVVAGDDGPVVALDNKPLIERIRGDGLVDQPDLQRVVVPLEIVIAITQNCVVAGENLGTSRGSVK